MESKVHHQDCTPKCCSKKHADYLLSAITRGKKHEDQVLSFLGSCHNVAVNKDSNGRTALQVAASFGCTKIMKWLLSLKDTHIIHIKDSESGYTPLHRAFYFGQLQAARCLLNHQASLFQVDNDYLTCMDHLIHDRLPTKPSNQLLEVCVWGSNSNYSLGLGNQQSPSTPELLEFFRKDKISMKQVAMSKFHSVFVSHTGQAYSCGHGLGGRLGKGSELPTLTPERLAIFDSEPCKFAAVGIDHTIFLTEEGKVWTCGMNQYHQLGHSPAPSKELAPKCISTFSGKNKSILIQGICASRYHSVFWSSDSLFTCGLNAGALGHIKGEKTIVLPKKVTSLSAPDLKITHVAASDGATAIATKKGDVYILHEYQCRKIASKQFELEKIVMIGGQLDSTILDEEKLRPVTLQVVLLTTSGKLFLWTQTNPILTRCFFRMGRPLVIRDIALNSASMFLISQESEVFTGTVIQKEKNKTNKMIPDQSDKIRRTNSWIEFAKREHSYQIKVQRVPFIYNAVSIACDPQGKNFSVIQVSPSTKLLDKIYMIPSQFQEDMKQLLDDATPQDPVHDITFVVNKRIFPAHRFILASTAPDFYKQFCSDCEGEILIEEIEEEVFELILHFIYSGNCEITPSIITEEESSSWKSSASNFYRTLQTWATKLGIDSLTNLLTKIRSNSIPDRLSTNLKPFSRGFLKELCDVKIRSEDGKEFDAHRVILAARLDYFRSMFHCGWIETTKMDVVNLPIHSSVLEILLDYIYRDRTPKIDKTDDISLIGNVLVVADQLLIPRLVSICEYLLVGLMSLKNVGQMLDFSSIYNAKQLKRSCMQFICFNLPAVVEMRIWDCLSEEVMEELTSFYKETHPRMIYRFMGPSSEAPSDEILDEYSSSLDQLFTFDSPTNKANNKVRTKVRRKSGQTQRTSETKERLSSVSSNQSVEDDWSPPATDRMISKPINIQWSKVGKVKKSGRKISNPEKGVEEIIGSPLKDLQLSASPITKKQVMLEDDPVTPSKPNLTLFELASVSKTITSSSSSNKKFPKLSQKQRKSQGSSNSKETTEVAESDPGKSPPLPVEQVKSPWMRKSSQPEETKCVPDNISFPVLAHQGIPEATATASSSMRSIIATEKLQVRNTAKTRSKPLRLTLIEDQAIADLHKFYQTDVVDDENITVVRLVPDEFALPVWSQKSRKF